MKCYNLNEKYMGLGVFIKNYDVIINKNIGILKGKDKLIFIKVGLNG